MVDFDKDAAYKNAASNPAGPSGLRQTATSIEEGRAAYAASRTPSNPGGDPSLQPWQPEGSWLDAAPAWYTGANQDSTTNGWDSEFWRKSWENTDKYYELASQSGKGSDFFRLLDDPTATGVAMWDDPNGRYKFGDVFVDGKPAVNPDGSRANLYTDYDAPTADVMMGEFMFSREEKERIFRSPNRQEEMAAAVAQRRQEWSEQAKFAPSAEQYAEDVDQTQETLSAGPLDDLGAALAGAGAGAALGAVGGPIGAVVGTFVGGAAALLNKDQMSEMTARAIVDTQRAWEYNENPLTTVAAGVSNAATVAMRASSPLSNFYQGFQDVVSPGGWGDGEAGFYRTDANGDRVLGAAEQGIDMVLSIGDSFLQFSSPAARGIYMTAMGAHVAGGVGDQVMGATFNPRIGAYDPFDTAGERMAAIGSTSIDLLQLGMARMLGTSAAAARAAATGERSARTGLAGRIDQLGDRVLGGGSMRGATQFETLNGVRFGLDDSLNVVGSRMTLQALVPSEFMRWLPTTWMARRSAIRAGRSGMTRDDLYEAAWMLAGRGSRTRNAIINAYAEGTEEFVQSILDPWSVSENPTMQDIVSATLYGAAGGAGMSLGRLNERPQGDAFSKKVAKTLMTIRNGSAPDDAEFDAMWSEASPLEKRRMSTLRASEAREMNQVLETNAEMMAMDATYNSVIGVQNLSNLSRNEFDKLHRKAAEMGQGSLVLMPMAAGTVVLPGGRMEALQYAANAAVMSAHQVGIELSGIARGMEAQAASIQAQMEEKLADLQALDGVAGEQADRQRQELQAQIDERAAMIADIAATLPVADQIVRMYSNWLDTFRAEADPERRRALIEEINAALLRAGKGRWENTVNGQKTLLPPEEQELLRRSVELQMARHPFINTGSFGLYIPQVSVEMTENNVHSTVYLHHSALKAPNADHDGDTGVVLHEAYLPGQERRAKRQGSQYVQQVPGPDGFSRTEAVVDMPDSEARFMRLFHEALADPGTAAAGMVHGQLNTLLLDLRGVLDESHGGPIPTAVLDPLLAAFRQGIEDGNPKARKTFLDDLLSSTPTATADLLALQETSQALDGVAFVPWFMWNVNFAFDRIQRSLATRFQTDPTTIMFAAPDELYAEASAEYMSRIAVRDAATAGQQLMATIDPTRATQQLHYSALYRALTLAGARGADASFTTPEQEELVARYAELGSGVVESELDMTLSKDSIERNVMMFLDRIVREATGNMTPMPELRLLMANMQVPDIRPSANGGYSVEVGHTTLLQLLLRKALEIEETKLTGAPDDAAAKLRIAKLRTMAYPKKEGRSYTASTVMVEMFGSASLYDLVGDTSMFLGSEMSLAQLVKLVTGMGSRRRSQFFHNLERSSAYLKDSEVKDPPWTAEQVQDGKVSAFAILIDAVKTYVDTEGKAMQDRDATLSRQFRDGLGRLAGMITRHQSTMNLPVDADPMQARRAALRDLLATDPRVTRLIADLIPESSAMGVFQVLDTGEVLQAEWLEDVLLSTDPAKAEVVMYVQLKLAEFNQLGGSVYTSRDGGQKQMSRGTVRYDQIKSRFLQTVYYLSRVPDGLELMRFLKTATDASSLEQLFNQINAEPDWLNDRQRLLPYYDDVSMFEAQPQDIWQSDLPYALQREAMEMFSTSIGMLEDSAAIAAQVAKDNREAYAGMRAVLEGTSNDPRYSLMLDQLDETIRLRQQFPDAVGPRARDQLMELFTEALIRLHDKGKIDEAARGFGESLVVLDAFGWKGSLMQATDAVTAYDWEDVVTNLTKLVDGPLRLQLDDGSVLTLDMSSREEALKLLSDPRTEQFALAVLMPSVRDVNSRGVLQTYRDTGVLGEESLSIEKLLAPNALRDAVFGDKGSRVEQAWRYIGMLESGLRRKALTSPQGSTPEALQEYIARVDAAHHPIQTLIDDFLIAYTQGPKWKAADKRELRDRLVVQVADAIKSMANVDTAMHQTIRDVVIGKLQEQFTGDSSVLDFTLATDEERSVLVNSLRLFLGKMQQSEIDTIKDRRDAELRAATTDDERNAALKKYGAMESAIVERYSRYQVSDDKLLSVPGILSSTVDSIVNSVQLTGDPRGDLLRKVQILEVLGKDNRVNRFRTKDSNELYHKVRRIIYSDNMALFRDATDPGQVQRVDDITLEEWNTLGGWAAAAMITDLGTRSGSEVALLPLVFGKNGDLIRRYYDASFGYLVDQFFDPEMLGMARQLATQASMLTPVTHTEMTTQFLQGLFNDGNLGLWTDRVPIESMKLRRVVETASTGAAIQTEGNDPKELAAYIAAGRVSFLLPDPDTHLSSTAAVGELGSGLFDMVPDAYKLVGRFARSVRLVPDPAVQTTVTIDPADLDLMPHLPVNEFNDVVRDSGYRVLDVNALTKRLDMLQAQYGSLPGMRLEIEYVDVDKLPSGPDTFEWANNIFFVGVGREAYRTATFGGLASLYFGSNGLSKLGQQNPLDAATKQGMRWRAIVAPLLADVEQAETAGTTVSEVLWNKVRLLFQIHYPTGDLLIEDIPALYELMKMRHVVVGENASGDKEVWWPQRLIEMEAQGITPPLTNIRLIPLNDSIAQQLHSGKGHGGLRTRVTRRELNLQDIVPFASLNTQRLKDLGLDRIGEPANVWNSPAAQVSVLPQASLVREDETRTNTIVERVRRWLAHREAVHTSRSVSRTEGKGRFDIKSINSRNLGKLNEMLSTDANALVSLMRKMGVPFASFDTETFSLNRKTINRLRRKAEKLNSNTVVWFHDQQSTIDPGQGVLGRLAAENGFIDLGTNGPTYGDTVVINVTSIMNVAGDAAVKVGKEVIRSYTERGLTVVLVTERGSRDVLNELGDWLDAGSQGYRSVAGSPNFFIPIDEDPLDGDTRRALNSTLTATHVIETNGVSLGLVSDGVASYLSENGGVADLQYDPGVKRVVANVIPARVQATGSVGDSDMYSFAYPADGDTRAWQTLRQQLIPLLETEEGLRHLEQLASGYTGAGDGNPPGVQLYEENPTTGERIPGVLGMREALTQLHDILVANDQPLAPGSKLQLGSIVPSISARGQIMLNRIGFLPPDMMRMSEMLNAPLGSNTGEPGTQPLGIAVAPAKLDKDATIGPVFTVSKVKSTAKGLVIIGEADLSGYSKTIIEGTGFKMGAVPMPNDLRFKDAVIRVGNAAGVRVTRLMSEKSVVGKEATPGLIDNFSSLFMLTGVNFEQDLMKFFFGDGVLALSKDEYDTKWNNLQAILKEYSEMNHGLTAEEIVRLLDKDFGQGVFETSVNSIGAALMGKEWQPIQLAQGVGADGVQARIATVLLGALAAPGVKLEHVLGTPGLATVTAHNIGLGVRQLPAIVTDALADSSYPEVRRELIGRANARMPKNPSDPSRPVGFFDEQLNFHLTMETREGSVWKDSEFVGQLQIQLPITHDVTGDTLSYAALTPGSSMSPHVVNVQNAADGAFLVPKGKKLDGDGNPIDMLPDRTDELFGDNEVLRFETGDGAVVWDMLTRVLATDPSYSPWERQLPMEERYRKEADLKVRYYTKPIAKDEWTKDDLTRALEVTDDILRVLGLTQPNISANREEIDYLVRQWYGAPAASNPEEEAASTITAKEYIQAVLTMRKNVDAHLHPLHSADVPLEHVMFWRKVFEAQKTRRPEDRWAPAKTEKMEKGRVQQSYAGDWADWVNTIMGQAMGSLEAFDGLFATALDGFYHTYQGSTPDFLVTSLSLDQKRQAGLMDPELNRTLLSIDPSRDAVLSTPIIIDSMPVEYRSLAGHEPNLTLLDAQSAEDSPRHKRRERQEAYRVKNKITRQRETSVREYSRTGLMFQESSRKTTELASILVNLSISMRLANPALYVSAIIEVPFRNLLERTTNVLTGQYTGVGGAALASVGEKVGLAPRFTPEELAKIDTLVTRLGESNMLLGEIFRDMVYAQPLGSKSAVGRFMEKTATTVARGISDPRWGMKANSAARRYIEGALAYLEMTNAQITVDQFVKLMNDNPLWLMEQYGQDGFNAHRAGVNNVAQVRSMRPTVAARGIMAPIDRMTESGSWMVNTAGHLLKIPFMFTRFNINLLMTITGLDALDQVAAMMMDGRRSPEIIKRMGALARGTEYDPQVAKRMDYSDVLEGIDISRIFVRSAVTQTGLMAAALMAGGLGLGGEDEEERRRRKLATYLNIPFLRDPRQAQNDFRFVDAIFLDNVPFLSTWFHKEGIDRSVVQPHWMLRQFMSPWLGIMRFFETGEINEIGYGFWDAAAAIPNSALNLWREADVTKDALAAAAADAGLSSDKDQQVSAFIIAMVGMYEKALIENQFVNSLRQAMDPIDRNPWLIPEINPETGEIVRSQGYALPQETDALVNIQTTGENGRDAQNRQAYLTRDPMSALLHGYAENNATFAALAAIGTGGLGSSFLRNNMVPKTPSVAVEGAAQEEVEAAVLASFMAQGGQPALTQREILQTLRDRETKAGRRWDNEKLNAEAAAIFEGQQRMDYVPSILDKDAAAVINNDAERGMFKSLHAGLVQFGDPIMSGFWADGATRDAIAEEWLDEIVEEGMALGLTQDSAKYRADRFWYGDPREGWVGLRELLYSNKIPTQGRVDYLQQNVTYVIGPDGRPWATPFEKANLLGTIFPAPRQLVDPGPGLSLDSRGNVIDLTRNVNTGLAGLMQLPQAPSNIEPNDAILDKVKGKDFGSDPTYSKFRRFPGSGGGYGYSPNFSRMPYLSGPRNLPRPDDIPFINVNTPYVRRARVNTERISSDRGRLKQWQ